MISELEFKFFTNLSESDRNLFDSSIYKIRAKKRERAKNLSLYKAADSDVLIELPAFNPAKEVTAPKGTTGLQLTFTAAVLSFQDQAQNKCVSVDWYVPYEDKMVPLHEIILPKLTDSQSLVVVVMGVRYYRINKNVIDQMQWKPVGIVGSFYN